MSPDPRPHVDADCDLVVDDWPTPGSPRWLAQREAAQRSEWRHARLGDVSLGAGAALPLVALVHGEVLLTVYLTASYWLLLLLPDLVDGWTTDR